MPAQWDVAHKIWRRYFVANGTDIWQVEHDLSLDAAFRYAVVNGHPVNEIRAGLTFALKEEGDRTPIKPGATFGNWSLSR